eukprot:NODE_877_length_3491_cov_0.367925.p1 type:complete len:203 gc:universal NODE_877_length_3491_cov_0.367925:3079-2471(-)
MAKGLSLEEKRTRALVYFHDTKGVYLMKELEKNLSKEKGITQMTVKEVVTSLVDDNLVVMEKIGTSNYFWAFPSHAKLMRQNKAKGLQQLHDDLIAKTLQQEKELESLRSTRQDPDRHNLIENYHNLKVEVEQLAHKLEAYKDFDPEILQFKKNAVLVAKEATNRWTDNVFTIQSYLNREHGIAVAQFNQMFEISDKFDNIE